MIRNVPDGNVDDGRCAMKSEQNKNNLFPETHTLFSSGFSVTQRSVDMLCLLFTPRHSHSNQTARYCIKNALKLSIIDSIDVMISVPTRQKQTG